MQDNDNPIEPVRTQPLNGGEQKVYRFENGYGASVVRGPYSYGGAVGLWEMAVVKWDGNDFELTYDTPITSDVIGNLSDAEVEEKLAEVGALLNGDAR